MCWNYFTLRTLTKFSPLMHSRKLYPPTNTLSMTPWNIYEAYKNGHSFSCRTSWWRRGHWTNGRRSYQQLLWRQHNPCIVPTKDELDNEPLSDWDWEWSAFFDCIVNNARGSHPTHDPSIKHIAPQCLKRMNSIDYHNIFMLWGYFWQHIVPSTSATHQEMGSKETLL